MTLLIVLQSASSSFSQVDLVQVLNRWGDLTQTRGTGVRFVMRVSVLMTLPAQEPLVESVRAVRMRDIPRIPFAETKMPSGVALALDFPPVPIGNGAATPDLVSAATEPRESELFVVRGSINVDSPEEIPEQVDGRPIFANPKIALFPTCDGSPAVGDLGKVHSKLGVPRLASLGLTGDGVAIAVMDGGINIDFLAAKLGAAPRHDSMNSWTVPGSPGTPFKYPVGHGSMCAYDVLIAAPKATLLDYSIVAHSLPGGVIGSRTVSAALQGFAHLLANWGVAFSSGGPRKYEALVVSNSWGIYHTSWDFPKGHAGRYCDNPEHPFNLIVTSLAALGVDMVFAAGNCGRECPDVRCREQTRETIMGAAAHARVLTLGGCDTSDARVGYSSQGPSIAGMPQEKPDLACYTHFLGSEALGKGKPDVGTSAAAPVAAGCVAALRTGAALSATPPAGLFAQLRASAWQPDGSNGWNADYGYGIIDSIAAARTLGLC